MKRSIEHQQFFQGPTGAIHATVAPQADDLVVTFMRAITTIA
jgi:hypothetical protein